MRGFPANGISPFGSFLAFTVALSNLPWRKQNIGYLGNQIHLSDPPKTALDGALRVRSKPWALRVDAILPRKTTPLQAPPGDRIKIDIIEVKAAHNL